METNKGNNLRSAALWFYGQEFIETAVDALAAYKKKNPTNPIGPGYAPFAIYFNFLHGIELCLKSYLVHEAGMRDEDLRSKEFGHNLDRLLEEALCHRLRDACTELTNTDLKTILFLSEHYSSKKFEYIWMGGSLKMLDIDQVAKTAKVLRSGLKNLVWGANGPEMGIVFRLREEESKAGKRAPTPRGSTRSSRRGPVWK